MSGKTKALVPSTNSVTNQFDLPSEITAGKIAEVNGMHRKFYKLTKTSLLLAYDMGKELFDMCLKLPNTISPSKFIADNFIFTPQAGLRYIRLFEKYKDHPELLEDLSLTNALNLPKKKLEGNRNNDGGAKPAGRHEIDWEEYFSKPTLLKNGPKKYRFELSPGKPENPPDTIFYIRKGFNLPEEFLHIQTGPVPPDIWNDYENMLQQFQAAAEKYFAKYEKYEED